MTRRPRARIDPLERGIETALAPGRYVSYNATFDFVQELEQVEQQLQRLIPTEPTRAVALYEAFLAGCCEKAEEIDDSNGSFGQFVGELFGGWIRVRQATAGDPAEASRYSAHAASSASFPRPSFQQVLVRRPHEVRAQGRARGVA